MVEGRDTYKGVAPFLYASLFFSSPLFSKTQCTASAIAPQCLSHYVIMIFLEESPSRQ